MIVIYIIAGLLWLNWLLALVRTMIDDTWYYEKAARANVEPNLGAFYVVKTIQLIGIPVGLYFLQG